jgi:hypothetical protein
MSRVGSNKRPRDLFQRSKLEGPEVVIITRDRPSFEWPTMPTSSEVEAAAVVFTPPRAAAAASSAALPSTATLPPLLLPYHESEGLSRGETAAGVGAAENEDFPPERAAAFRSECAP